MALDKKKLREQWDSLTDEEKTEIRDILKSGKNGDDDDDDTAVTLKDVLKRLTFLETAHKKGTAKKNGFISALFGD